MKPIRALPLLMLLPLLPALWSALALDAAPEADNSLRSAALFLPVPAELPKPLAGLPPGDGTIRTAARRDALPQPSAAARPRWPADWPSLDAFPAGGSAAAMQMMGSGDFDIEVPASTDGGQAEEEVDAAFDISNDPPQGGEKADGGRAEDGEAEKEPNESVVDAFDQRPEIAEGRRRREEAQLRREREEEEAARRDLEEFDLTDEERAERRRRDKEEEEEGRRVIAEVDAEIDRGGDPFGELPPVAPPPEAGAEPEAERPTTQTTVEALPPAPVPGYRLTTPDGQPVERVVVGQSFHVELRVTPEEASIPGQLGGTRELEFLEVTLISEEGNEQTIRLWRAEEPSEDGLIRFASKEPISIAAKVNGNPLPGTIEDLDLDFQGREDGLIQPVEIRARGDIENGATVIVVYGKPITAAIAEVKDALNTVEEYLRAERQFVEGLMEDAAGDEEVLAELRSWLTRIDAQLSVAAEARQLAEYEYNEEYQLVLSSKLLQTLIEQGPNGWEVSEDNPLVSGHGTTLTFNDLLFMERKKLDERYRGRAIVQQAALDVIAPYLLTSYSQFAHITMAAPAVTLVTGLDEFNKEGSRVWAAVELGFGALFTVIAIKLPSSIHSYIDEGRLIPSKNLDFRSSSAGAPLARRPGRAGAQPPSVRGRGFIPGEKPGVGAGATPRARVGRAETEVRTDPAADVVTPEGRVLGRAGVETRGGELPYPGRGPARRGLDPETRRYWQEKTAEDPVTGEPVSPSDPVTGEIQTPPVVNRHLASMDDAVHNARQRGVPDEVIDQTLLESRVKDNAREASEFVGTRLELEITTRERGRIFTTTADKTELQFEGFATPQQLENVTVIDIPTLEGVITKSHLEASGKPQTWTVEEIQYGRSITRRLEAGEDVSQWKTVDFGEGPGLRPLFGADDLGAIRSTFTSRPLRVATETAPPSRLPAANAAAPGAAPVAEAAPSRGAPAPRTVEPGAQTETVGRRTQRVDPPERPADTEVMTPNERAAAVERTTPRQRPAPEPTQDGDVFGPPPRTPEAAAPPPEVRPLASAEQYRELVARQAAGETIDLTTVARPGIARVTGDAIGVVQGAGRWENTRPGDFLDVFVPANAEIPAGVEFRVLETNVPAEVVQQANLLSSRGAAGTNPRLVELAVRDVPQWNRVQVRAEQVVAPTSRVAAEIEGEMARLAEEGVNVGALAEAVAPLAPAERLAVIRDPVRRADALAAPAERPAAPTGTVVDPVAEPTALGGPSGRGQSGQVEVLIRALGGSTGRVVEAFVANHGDQPVRIQGSGVALEPVDLDEAGRVRADEILEAATQGKALPPPEPDDDRTVMEPWRSAPSMPPPPAWRSANVVRVVLEGYCLDLQGGVPTEGVFFRIADAQTQAANETLRAILESSRVLRDEGALHPDTEPEAYFHSVRQWAVWVDQNGLDRAGFEKEFIAHTRRNFEAADREWTDEAETLLKEFIPNRWNDIVAVLEGAGLAVPANAN